MHVDCLDWRASMPNIALYTRYAYFCSTEVSPFAAQMLGIIADKMAAVQVAFSLAG